MHTSQMHVPMMEDVARQGYCWIEDTTEADMWSIAIGLGTPRYETRDRQIVKLIRPRAEGLSQANTLSSRHGTASFPFHTDAAYWPTPPRFLLLRCLDPGEGGRSTLLSDTHAWLSKRQWNVLNRAVCAIAGSRPFLAPIAARNSDGPAIIRYDVACMRPTSRRSSMALALVDVQTAEAQVTEIHWRHRALLVIDNHRLLHARSESPKPDPSRLHQKMLIEEVSNGSSDNS